MEIIGKQKLLFIYTLRNSQYASLVFSYLFFKVNMLVIGLIFLITIL